MAYIYLHGYCCGASWCGFCLGYVQSMSHVGSDRGCSQAGRLDGAILFGWECLVLWMHAVPCYLASRLENWLGLFYLAAQM